MRAVEDMVVAERKANRRLYKATIGTLRIIPMLLALCAMLNMLFDFFGIDSFIVSTLGGLSVFPLLFLYLASNAFSFCVYHRMFLHYVVANNVLTYADYYIGIPVSDAALFMIHVLMVGIFLFLILYFYRREKCCGQLRKSYSAS